MGKFSAVVCTLTVLSAVPLFLGIETPIMASGVSIDASKFVVAWTGWKFCGVLYMALVNWEVDLGLASALTMIPYVAFDIYAANDPAHWTPLATSFIFLDAVVALSALGGYLKVGGVINALYVLAGIALFVTGEAPVIQPSVDFLNDKFAQAWAGWKFAGCLYMALVNLGAHPGLSMAASMAVYVAFDVFALSYSGHWTHFATMFIVVDGTMGILGLKEYFDAAPKTKAKAQ